MKIVFDVETNGLNPRESVLSFSAVLLDDDLQEIEVWDRYYYPTEAYNSEAVSINGLTEEAIRNYRKGCSYPEHFKDDEEVKELFNRADIDKFIAHNIPFDRRFVERHLGVSLDRCSNYCTMRATQYRYDAPYIHNATGEPKYPKLSEAVEWAGIDTKAIMERTGKGYHDSLFDVYCTIELYKYLQVIETEEAKEEEIDLSGLREFLE